MWDAAEENALKAGVKKHGLGAWERIRTDPEFTILLHRTGVQLKDKWRNLVKFRHITPDETLELQPKTSGPWHKKYTATAVAAAAATQRMAREGGPLPPGAGGALAGGGRRRQREDDDEPDTEEEEEEGDAELGDDEEAVARRKAARAVKRRNLTEGEMGAAGPGDDDDSWEIGCEGDMRAGAGSGGRKRRRMAGGA